MRFSTVAAAVCLSLSPLMSGFAAAPALSTDAPGTAAPAATVPAAANVPAAPNPAPAPSGDAAAKHAKRTACLKDAKAKKLVGAEKTEFLRSCMAAP
jgi:hypothetical protein